MSKDMHDNIGDDEIRIISSSDAPKGSIKRNSTHKVLIILLAIAAACLIAAVAWYLSTNSSTNDADELQLVRRYNSTALSTDSIGKDVAESAASPSTLTSAASGYVNIIDTIAGGEALTLLIPACSSSMLALGDSVLDDSTVVMAVQAADVRRDNGGIVGAYVLRGELLSKGQAKSGFCAIIDGKMTIGVADATPLLEQSLESEGYFFRQYPLVVGGQIVENKPRGKALRKALVELNGTPAVVLSRRKLTFHEFSESLVDLGVSNAIYLVGSSSFGFAVDDEGSRYEFGRRPATDLPNVNYLVWR